MFNVPLKSIFLPAPVNGEEQHEMFLCGSRISFTHLDEKLFQAILGSEKKVWRVLLAVLQAQGGASFVCGCHQAARELFLPKQRDKITGKMRVLWKRQWFFFFKSNFSKSTAYLSAWYRFLRFCCSRVAEAREAARPCASQGCWGPGSFHSLLGTASLPHPSRSQARRGAAQPQLFSLCFHLQEGLDLGDLQAGCFLDNRRINFGHLIFSI